MADVFTKGVRGIRRRYAATAVVFLLLTLGLFYVGGLHTLGVYATVSTLVCILALLALFLMQGHCVLAPIERLTAEINSLLVKTLDGQEPLRIDWSGEDEFANLAAAMNGLLEAVQSRSLGAMEENRRLKDIVSNAEVELVAMNRNGSVLNVIHCPEGMDPVPGLAHGFAPDQKIWGRENCEAFAKGLAAVCESGQRQSVELSFKTSGGHKTRRLKAVITRAKESIFPIVYFRDLGRPAEQGANAERKVPVSRLAAGIASDLKNVFSVIQTSVGHYSDSKKPEVLETVSTVLQAVRLGSSMLDELETLSGELHLKLRPCSAKDMIAGARVLLDGLLEGSGARIGYTLAAALPTVFVDQGQINRVFVNVVRNSLEAFGSVPGRIVVSARPYDLSADEGQDFTPPVAAGEGVLITVADNGPGMSEHIRVHALEPYSTTKANGRGLGLAIADAIVAAHGGGMRITTVKGVSTEVSIFLRKAEQPAEDLDLLRKTFPGGEVLVVDDNAAVLRITAALLRTQKIAAHVADSRNAAVQKFSKLNGRLRAVLLDVQLGADYSIGLLADFRAINPHVPVIAVSGYTEGKVRSIFADNMPEAFMMKPYSVAELKQVLSSLPNGGG